MKTHPNPPEPRGFNRRAWLATSAAGIGGWLTFNPYRALAGEPASAKSYRFCLNMGTVRGHNLSITQEVEIAAQAGYDAIEPWMDRLSRYVKEGGSLKDLRQKIADRGLTLESAIGFPSWAVDDEAQRAKGLEQMKSDMDWLAQLGAQRVAAPPAGIPQGQRVEPERLAERYRQVLELGDRMGVVPILEFWGKNPSLGKLSTAMFVAAECGHPKACVLTDVFHMYRGGSSFEGLRQMGPHSLPVMHLNDYPADPPLDKINDSHRVFPGDGIAPLSNILRICRSVGAQPVLSLEVFNQEYYKRDALEVARTGLQKMKTVAAAAMA